MKWLGGKRAFVRRLLRGGDERHPEGRAAANCRPRFRRRLTVSCAGAWRRTQPDGSKPQPISNSPCSESSPSLPRGEAPEQRNWLKWALAAAVAATGVAAFLWFSRPLPVPRVTGIAEITHDSRPIFSFPPFISDGSRLFFSTNDTGVPAYQVSLKGGESVPLTMQMRGVACLLDINPERTEFLACRGSELRLRALGRAYTRRRAAPAGQPCG